MKKICIITGTRAEWGLFYPLAKRIKRDKDLDLQIIATGMHLSRKYGLTYKEIEQDGFKINRKEKILCEADTEQAMAKSMGKGVIGLTEALKSLEPDLLILLGDRFEIFAAAIASFILKIPIAHLHGGELTEGAMDDAFRHSITKMASLHFVSTGRYAKRVIQMGESPDRVFNVGALGLDAIKNTEVLNKSELERELNFKFGERNFLVTFHPVTLEARESSEKEFGSLLKVMDTYKDAKIIFTRPNCDIYSGAMNNMIDKYLSENKGRAACFTSLGRKLYFSVLQFVDLVAGNSSSGIIEVPSFRLPTVNIGYRQEGREKAVSVIDVDGSYESVKKAFDKALSVDFKEACRCVENPYGDSNTAQRIVETIKRMDNLRARKKFYDINFNLRSEK